MKLILLGAPGAGKGTQAEFISNHYEIPIVSTGNILKEAMRNGTELGVLAKGYIDHGNLVPDDVVIGIVKERLAKSDCANGFVLDGMPRTIAQADALEELGIEIDEVISLEVPDEVIVARMSGRRTCSKCGATYHVAANPPKAEGVCDKCGSELIIRSDDEESTVLTRLNVYHETTEQLKDYYRAKGKLRTVDGTGSIEEITRAVLAALEE